jgi:hypothetical protein
MADRISPESGIVRERCYPIRDKKTRRAWAASFPYCMACGASEYWPGLQTHHLIKFKRSDECCNFLRLCTVCHQAAEGIGKAPLTLAHCLWIKKERDPENWNPERLAQLYGKPLPDLCEPPLCFQKLFTQNQKEEWEG